MYITSTTASLGSIYYHIMHALFYLISDSPDSKMWNSILMAIVGFFIGGPANLISSAISADLGKNLCSNEE